MREFNWKHYLPLFIVVSTGIVATAVLGYMSSHYESLDQKDSFQKEATRKVNYFSSRINKSFTLLYDLQNFYRSSHNVSREEFEKFTRNLKEWHPNLKTVYYFSGDYADGGIQQSGFYRNQFHGRPLGILDSETSALRRQLLSASSDSKNSIIFLPFKELLQGATKTGKTTFEGDVFALLPLQKTDRSRPIESNQDGVLAQVFSLPDLRIPESEDSSRNWIEIVLTMPGESNGNYYRISESGVENLTDKPTLDQVFSLNRSIQVHGKTLQVQAVPTAAFYGAQDHWWTEIWVIVGLLLTGFFGFYTKQFLDERERVREKVTERTRELEKAKREAEEANRAKSDFLAKMSHELRTPLTTILGYQDLLMDSAQEQKLDDNFVEDLEQIERSASHLLELINEILDLSKIAAGKMDIHKEKFDVEEMIDEVAKTVDPLIDDNNNELVVSVDDDVGSMYSDRTKIRQCLFNLLSNAAKFTHSGRIFLSAEKGESSGEGRIRFSVRDTGMGIEPEQQEALFEAFEQVDDSRTNDIEGTGLGLAITKKFTELLGGSVEFESKPGEGTTFVLKFPSQLSDVDSEGSVPKGDKRETSSDDQRETVDERQLLLAIDDEAEATELVRRYLEPEGYRVETVQDGREGLEKAINLEPDAIILDVMMPEVDGWDVLSELKDHEKTADIPVIMVSVTNQGEIGASLGADEFLMKPIESDQLIELVNDYTENRSGSSIMIVDDNQDIHTQFHRVLADGDRVLHKAVNGKDALEQLGNGADPDLIVLDLMMPEMDGKEFLEELRHGDRDNISDDLTEVPVVVLTNKQLSEAEKNQFSMLVQDIWKKGDDPVKRLSEKIQKLASQTNGEPMGGE